MTLQLHNTLTRKKDTFTLSNDGKVRMYVCGPTVYDRPHLGNARSVVVYDVLYRVLMQLYGKENVIYARNITDVDDKINAAAKANHEPISALTKRVEDWFHHDIAMLNCLNPTHEPRATAHIAQMITLIESLIAHKHAYVSQGHVLFAVDSYKDYGQLSGRKLDELVAGSRVEVEGYKKHPGDFVLWKPSEAGDDPSSVFDSPWGKGRPGWHIECSAMSHTYLGENFDIHGGGADLMFPHHENEIAQSCCALPGSTFARTWVHNGFLTVNGEKMSKSLGNFITVHDLLEKGVQGEVIRLAFLMTKYNEPLDWSEKLLHDAKTTLDYMYRCVANADIKKGEEKYLQPKLRSSWKDSEDNFINSLCDDLNLPLFITHLRQVAELSVKAFREQGNDSIADMYAYIVCKYANLIGLLKQSPDHWFKGEGDDSGIQAKIDARIAAKKNKDWATADLIRKELSDAGIILEDRPDGTTDWRKG